MDQLQAASAHYFPPICEVNSSKLPFCLLYFYGLIHVGNLRHRCIHQSTAPPYLKSNNSVDMRLLEFMKMKMKSQLVKPELFALLKDTCTVTDENYSVFPNALQHVYITKRRICTFREQSQIKAASSDGRDLAPSTTNRWLQKERERWAICI